MMIRDLNTSPLSFCTSPSSSSATTPLTSVRFVAKMGEHVQEPTPENMTMLQGFEWYIPADQKHWVRLEKHVRSLKKWGIDNIWVPPA